MPVMRISASLADDVEDTPQRFRADGDRNRGTRVAHVMATNQALGAVHGDGPHGVLAEMLRHFQDQLVALVLRFERIQDRRQIAFELHIDHRPHHLRDLSDDVSGHPSVLLPRNAVPVRAYAALTWLPWRR